jgi:hypothetical protein
MLNFTENNKVENLQNSELASRTFAYCSPLCCQNYAVLSGQSSLTSGPKYAGFRQENLKGRSEQETQK